MIASDRPRFLWWGSGNVMVDHQDASTGWWVLANAVQPLAIITFSRTGASLSWELEMNQCKRTSRGNEYITPTQPTRSPPDDFMLAGSLRALGLDSFRCVSGSEGGFVSEFVAYLDVAQPAAWAAATRCHRRTCDTNEWLTVVRWAVDVDGRRFVA